MTLDPHNPVVALCAAGMQVEGTPDRALALFERAWAQRTDDFDACVAAHYVARHQATSADTLRWNEVALQHADAVTDPRVHDFIPSLCLCLADSYLTFGRLAEAERLAWRTRETVDRLPVGGYRELIRGGVARLTERLRAASAADAAPD